MTQPANRLRTNSIIGVQNVAETEHHDFEWLARHLLVLPQRRVFVEFVPRDELVSREDALDQPVALFPRDQYSAVYVVNDKREERKHDAEMQEAQVLNIHYARNPAEEPSQQPPAPYLRIQREPGNDLKQHE